MGLKILFLSILSLSLSISSSQLICNKYCDERDLPPTNPRIPVTTEIWSRKISLIISDDDNMGLALIENGDSNDEVWIDRSFDGGQSWNEDKLGLTLISSGQTSVQTKLYNVDNPSTMFGIGALRACGKAGDRDEIGCTPWARSSVNSETEAKAGVTAMMQFYNENGLWSTTGWWNAANVLTALIDHIRLTGDETYKYAIDYTFVNNINEHDGNYTNDYIDDTLWWGLAWLDAYDLTGDVKYLEMAKIDSDYCYDGYRDDVCDGGLWWSTAKTYKNAVTNELFIKLAAAIHNRIPGDVKYLNQALEVWQWFQNSGMINEDNLINDGLNDDCENNRDVTWTYNQGIILGAFVELSIATGNRNFTYSEGKKIANAVIESNYLSPNGILREPCEDDGCGGDGPSFKGVFMRNLGELDRFLPGRPYWSYILQNKMSNWENNRNELNQFGLKYAGPFDKANAAYQHSALESFNAAN